MGLTVKPGDPVLDVFVAADGKFGFIELRTVQVKTLNPEWSLGLNKKAVGPSSCAPRPDEESLILESRASNPKSRILDPNPKP
jgi:hypothetical protein